MHGPILVHKWEALTGLDVLQKEKKRDMKLREGYAEGKLGEFRGENKDKYHHSSLYTCLKFSQININNTNPKLLTDPHVLIKHVI